MADWAGIAGGLGKAATGWTTGLVEKPAYDESLAQIKENQRLRQNAIQDRSEQQDVKQTGDIADSSNLAQFADQKLNPWQQASEWEKQLRAQAAGQSAPAAPGAAPVPGAPPAPPGAGIGAGAAAAAAAKAPAGVPPAAGPAPQPGEWKDTGVPAVDDNHKEYEAKRQQVAADLQKIDAAAGADEAKKNRMRATYFRMHKPEFEALDKKLQDYKESVVKDVQHQRAVSVVQAMRRGDASAIEGFFGKGARLGKDPVTNLDGILVPVKDAQGNPMLDGNGKPQTRLVAQNTAAAMVMWENGLIDQKEMAAIEDTDAKDIAANTRERMSTDAKIAESKAKVSAASLESKNKDIQLADRIEKVTEQIARAKAAGKDTTGLEANLQSLKTNEYKAETVRDKNDAQAALKTTEAQEKMAKALLKNFVEPAKDRFGELTFVPRNKDPKAALDAFKRLKENGGIGAAMYFFDGLQPEQQSAIKNYNVDQESGDMGGSRPKESRSAPAEPPKADIAQERRWAQEALKAQPQNAAKIRKAFREKNGVDI
jgi:hypothetical protein